jgi:membrane-bound metal-dependent hydrolase YbcI (DUF457 family)
MAQVATGRASPVIAGHFGFAALVKARERPAPLWALMLATVWLDIVFVPLFVAGIETIEVLPGTHGGYGTGIIHADYTHSLVGALLLSLLFGVFFGARAGRRTAVVLALVSFSHWVLDLIVHRADMPLLPGNAGHFPKFGFGLWRFPAASAVVELVLVAAGAWVYWRAAREVSLAAGSGQRRAAVVGWMILIGGTLVLALDVTGLLG